MRASFQMVNEKKAFMKTKIIFINDKQGIF